MTEDHGGLSDELFGTIQDVLGDLEVVQSDVESTLQDDLPPQATYQTNPEEYPISVNAVKFEEKIDDKGRLLPARVSITFSGMAFARVKDKDHRLRFQFQMSPNKMKKRIFETQDGKMAWTGEYGEADDLQTRLYAQAVKTYQIMNGEYPKKVDALVSFLKENPFRMRTFNTPDGKSLVIQLSATKRG